MGKRVLFTQKEIKKYSKTYEGRQYMNKKKINVGIFLLAFGVFLLLISIFIVVYSPDYMKEFAFMPCLLAIYCLIHGCFYYFVYRHEYKHEESQEKERQILKQQRIDNIRNASFDLIDKMMGYEFEEYCSIILNDLGYVANPTKKSGDFGVDIIAKKNNEKIIIQTKRYTNKVSISAVQEISAAKNYYHSTAAWIITNNYFTKSAKELAESNNIILIDRDELAKLILLSKKINKGV